MSYRQAEVPYALLSTTVQVLGYPFISCLLVIGALSACVASSLAANRRRGR